MLNRFRESIQKFLGEELWFLDLTKQPSSKRIWRLSLRRMVIVSKGLVSHNCGHSASALTFITLAYIVPLLAIVFSVAKGFNAQELLQESLHKYTGALPDQAQLVIQQIFDLVNQTDFTALGVIGVLLLFSAILKSLGAIEQFFNTIWGIKTPQPLKGKAANYLLVFVLVPSFIILSSTTIAALSTEYIRLNVANILGSFYMVYEFVVAFVGIFGVISAFMILYIFLPNTKVNFSSAFVGAFCAGLAWYLIQWGYINLQIGVTRYNTIYGVFASLPIFLFWIYLNWIVVLFGAEVTFSMQNPSAYLGKFKKDSFSHNTTLDLACLVVEDVCKQFNEGNEPWTPENFRCKTGIPLQFIHDIVHLLTHKGYLSKKSN